MTKPCRDSKGRFVSREAMIKVLKDAIEWLHYMNANGVKDNNLSEKIYLFMWTAHMAYLFRQFRIRYGIYETF